MSYFTRSLNISHEYPKFKFMYSGGRDYSLQALGHISNNEHTFESMSGNMVEYKVYGSLAV